MKPSDIFPPQETGELEESIRVDRESDDEDKDRIDLLKDYHVTEDSEEFLREFLQRVIGQTEQKRRGWNHWLYGYYGSGKSHLLAILGFLTDSAWIDRMGKDKVWDAFTEGTRDLPGLRSQWEQALDAHHLQPLFVNLLKYQGRDERGFNEILLGEAHAEEGLSRRLDVAYFERWYEQHSDPEEWDAEARRVLQDAGVGRIPDDAWSGVQTYRLLAEIVLPELFERATGTRDGRDDLVPSHLNPSEVLSELEEWRTRLEDEHERDVKLLLLLDEISLFIGTDYDQLTELQLVAEKIDDVGQGNILSVVTAQERIEHVQPEYASKSPDFGILKDRFPHRRQLPSRHVGEIVRNRLLMRPKEGGTRDRLEEEVLDGTSIRPEDTFIYSNVQQNTTPPLDSLDHEDFLDYYPLLPYHPPLFLEILSNLRGQSVDRAKSIFSGTARAVLAIVDALIQKWRDEDDREATELVNLVDFYEVIREELLEIIPTKVASVDEIEDEFGEDSIEADVAKAILLLRPDEERAQDLIPVEEHENIAVSIMRDLEGPTRIAMTNEVDDALKRLDKYLGPDLEFRDAEEREIYEQAQAIEERENWAELFDPIAEELWGEILRHLDLPEELPYPNDGDAYPVTYTFEVDGRPIKDNFGADEGLEVPIVVEGLIPAETGGTHHDKLVWTANQEGRSPLPEIKGWAALACAMQGRPPQKAVQQDLEERKHEAAKLAAKQLETGSFRVREREPNQRNAALRLVLEQRYPSHFHPVMLEVDESNLRELRKLAPDEERPPWAAKLQVPTEDPSTHQGDIYTKVRALVGRSIKQSENEELSVSRLLELIEADEPFYEDLPDPIVAILWGLCKKGDFIPVDIEGEPVQADALLDRTQWGDIRVRIAGLTSGFRDAVEQIPTVEATDTNNQALVKLRAFLDQTLQDLDTLVGNLDVTQRAIQSDSVEALLGALDSRIETERSTLQAQISEMRGASPDWSNVVQQALDAHRWVEDVRDQWDHGESFLLHLDALLILPDAELPWVDEEARTALRNLHQQTENAAQINWWTQDGWKDLTTSLTTRGDALDALEGAWTMYKTQDDRHQLATRLEDNPWTRPPIELPPPKVHKAFQDEILYPLRAFRKAFQTQDRIASRLLDNPSDTSAQELQWLLGELDDYTPRSDVPDPNEVDELLDRLHKLVGDKGPEDVTGIGLVPEDLSRLRANLEELEALDERSIRRIDGAAVIE